MKLASLLALLSQSLIGEQILRHVQQYPIDAYIASYATVRPQIPGASAPENGIEVSLNTSDELTEAFVVYVRVRLDDGTESPRKALVTRTPGVPAIIRFSTGSYTPVKISHFYVLRLHSEPIDQLILDLD